jgi:hypothetical protein
MKTLARLISYLFHPLLFPTYGSLLVLAANPNMFGQFGQRLHIAWLIIVFSLTFIFPAVWILMMKRLEMIESLNLETTRDRIIPFIATATFYLWTTWMFKPNTNLKIPPNELIFFMMMGATIAIFIAFFLNIYTKVSLHTLGAGSLLGLILVMIRYSTYDLRWLLVAIILLAGVIGTARLLLKSHTGREVFTGYFIGFSGQFMAFSIIARFLL